MADRDHVPPAAQPFDGLTGTEPGDTVGGYELLREIGRGGMAEVWLARRARSSTGKFVALKMILPRYVGVDRYSRMFASEAEVAAPLSHSNIVQVFDEGEDHGRSYLVMEWVDGADLAQLLPSVAELRLRDPHLRLRIAAYVIGQVLHGLSYAHRITSHRGQNLGIVHRDISPQNVLVSVSGDVKVTDFGIAHRMTDETAGVNVKGKLRYMAPEQLAGSSHAPTVDLYAVGALLHELLDGIKFRADADDQAGLYHLVMSGRVPTLQSNDVPAELEAVRRALLEPEPSRRPQTADAAVLLLKRWSGYSEMRVELGMLCGLATGVVRPRTGPIVAHGMPTVPPRSSARALVESTPGVPVRVEADAPIAPWGVSPVVGSTGTAVLTPSELHGGAWAKSLPTIGLATTHEVVAPPGVDRRDLEPTHSSVHGRMAPSSASIPRVEATASDYDLIAPPRARTAVWRWIAAALGMAVLGALATSVLVKLSRTPRVEREPTTVRVAPAAIEAPEPIELAPEPELAPVRAPIVVAAKVEPHVEPIIDPVIEAPATPAIDVAEPPPPAAPPRAAKPKRAPPVKKLPKRASVPSGPEVTVHFRLEGELTGADLLLGTRVITIRPRFDGRIAAGRYVAKFRVAPSERWRAAGTLEIGPSGEWKLLVGPSGARVRQM